MFNPYPDALLQICEILIYLRMLQQIGTQFIQYVNISTFKQIPSQYGHLCPLRTELEVRKIKKKVHGKGKKKRSIHYSLEEIK